MRVLFVPAHRLGILSHGFPLLALNKRLKPTGVTSAFLVPKRAHDLFRMEGAEVLDISHENLTTQMLAYRRYKPDVVIDDFSVTTALADQVANLPRITIQRTGTFPGGSPRNKTSIHSIDAGLRTISEPNVRALGLATPRSPTDIVNGDAVVVPGIRSIELLPGPLKNSVKHFFAGPLIIRDYVQTESCFCRDFSAVDKFLEKHSNRNIVVFAFGTIAEPPSFLQRILNTLLKADTAVISTVPLALKSELLYYCKLLPLHRICPRICLMIHHCGSGTYQYPILYQVPSITIATHCYDRDDVGRRLQELGASVHIDPEDDPEPAEQRCIRVVLEYLNPDSNLRRSTLAVLSRLNRETERTAATFNFLAVLDKAIQQRLLRT